MAPRFARLLLLPLLCLSAPALAQAADGGGPDSALATPTPESARAVEASPAAPHPLAGFGNEAFFLRSDDDDFILIPAGRLRRLPRLPGRRTPEGPGQHLSSRAAPGWRRTAR